jgi:TolB-like protein/Tfp pilus assembly protein PilF
MKPRKCPSCGRVYVDEALNYCLDDGASLIYESDAGEMPTAILNAERYSGDHPTKRSESNPPSTRLLGLNKRWFFTVTSLALAVIAFATGLYWYYNRPSEKTIDSIAVMPFVNESGNADVEYLSDGMTETLINSLTQLPDLNVKPRSSTFRYRGRESEAKVIGNELNVGAILFGRLVQRGNDITLFLSLIDTRTENQIWGKQYSRSLANLVTLQTEIAHDVSEKLQKRLTIVDNQRLSKNYTANPEAYRLYLQGRFFWNKRRGSEMGKAISYFQQAIALDPNYALAYAGLADALAQPSDVYPPNERAPRAREAIMKALSLDGDLAEAHTALAHILTRYDLDFAGAERELARSIELNPNWADTYQRYGELYAFIGRFDESLAKFQQGLEIEPFCHSCRSSFGGALIAAGRFDDAIVQFNKTLEMDPTFIQAHRGLSLAFRYKGMYAESVEEYAKSLELSGEAEAAAGLRQSFAKRGWIGYLRADLERFTTGDRSIDKFSYYGEATIRAQLGEIDKAFEALSKSLENHENPALAFLKTDRRLESLHSDPRFEELVQKLGFPE